MRPRRQPEIIAGRVNADGSIAAGDGFTVSRTSAGVYNLTFATGFRLISATVTAATGAWVADTWSGNGFRVVMANSIAGAGADIPFAFTAVGVQT